MIHLAIVLHELYDVIEDLAPEQLLSLPAILHRVVEHEALTVVLQTVHTTPSQQLYIYIYNICMSNLYIKYTDSSQHLICLQSERYSAISFVDNFMNIDKVVAAQPVQRTFTFS